MTVAWIMWRNADKVATFYNQFRATCRYWRLSGSKSRGIRPDGKGPMSPLPIYTLQTPMPATLTDVKSEHRRSLTGADSTALARSPHVVPFDVALEALQACLIDGGIEAHALEFDTNRSSLVPPHAWRYADLRVHDGSTCIFIADDIVPAFRSVTFSCSDVVTNWTEEPDSLGNPHKVPLHGLAGGSGEENFRPGLKASKEQRRLSDKVRSGRPPKFDWVAFDRKVFDILDGWGGIQLTADPLFNRAKLRKEMGDWMATRYKNSPSDATLKRQISRAVAAYEQHVLERNR